MISEGMITIALAVVALQSSPTWSQRDTQYLTEGQELTARLDTCIEASVAKFIASNEPADVVASVAMWECQGRALDVFENGVRYMQAVRPNEDASTIRREQAAKHPAFLEARKEQAIYYVVTQRLGLSWHMPVEDYNSIKR